MTERQLRRLIQEEISNALNESSFVGDFTFTKDNMWLTFRSGKTKVAFEADRGAIKYIKQILKDMLRQPSGKGKEWMTIELDSGGTIYFERDFNSDTFLIQRNSPHSQRYATWESEKKMEVSVDNITIILSKL